MYVGWVFDGVDLVIYVFVLIFVLIELLLVFGIVVMFVNFGMYGLILFVLFLIGWGLLFIWGLFVDCFGCVCMFVVSILIYLVFIGVVVFVYDVWVLVVCCLIVGIGVGGEWVFVGIYVVESWLEDCCKMGVGYL